MSQIRAILDRLQARQQELAPKSASRALDATFGRRRSSLSPYMPGEGHQCPSCGHRGILVGRSTAECGRCGTPMPLIDEAPTPHSDRVGPPRMTPIGAIIDWVTDL
jgi:hypothetical protein